jgi:GNAT superfamily N-acetyltransferase
MHAPLQFRRALIADAALLSGIARAAKQYWGYPPEWMEAWAEVLTITPEYLQAQPVCVAEQAGQAVGFFGLRGAEDGWHLEHLWVRPAFVRRGYGRELFTEARRLARQAGATELLIKSDPNAEAFYLRMGAVRTGQEVYLLLGRIRRELPELTCPL